MELEVEKSGRNWQELEALGRNWKELEEV